MDIVYKMEPEEIENTIRAVGDLLRTRKKFSSKDVGTQIATLQVLKKELEKKGW